jgi:FlaA1/EpsC-like NDP-sugar epimerase
MYPIYKFVAKIFSGLKNFPYLSQKSIFIVDLLIAAVSFTISYWICFNLINVAVSACLFIIKLLLCLLITGSFFLIFRTQTNLLRYSTFKDIFRVFLATVSANVLLIIFNHFLSGFQIYTIFPEEIFFINFLFTFCFIFIFRMSIRLLFDFAGVSHLKTDEHIFFLVYGVESSNIALAKMILANDTFPYRFAGFLTPDKEIGTKQIINYPVYTQSNFFAHISEYRHIRAILISPKEIGRTKKQFLAEKCMEHKIDILSIPPVEDWRDLEKNLTQIEKIKIEDLLGRIPIQIDIESIGKNLKGKVILITGAAGSIGSEIIRQICRFDLNLLLICDIAENSLHQLGLELEDKYAHITFVPIICDVKNYNQMQMIFEKYNPHYIYHAAAYKHVPLMENHPCEAVLTNVQGSMNIVDLAVRYHAEVFVMISTDKAVNPSNIMGASKRIAEIYVQSLFRMIKIQSADSEATRIITTRFGNVLGSSGSVIPRFNSQIKQGGPVTVTDPDIIRYFMTIPEACRLVLEAGNFGKGGEIFVFDMGEAVSIKDLAEKMIRLSGLEPYKDIKIKFTGLRPGEKLHEELLYDKETVIPTHNEKILIGAVQEYDYKYVLSLLTLLIETANKFDKIETVRLMKKLVPEFISQNSVYEELDKA